MTWSVNSSMPQLVWCTTSQVRVPKSLCGDDQGADRVVGRPTARIADHVRVAFGEAGILGWVETRVHAGQDRELPRRGERQAALGAELAGIGRHLPRAPRRARSCWFLPQIGHGRGRMSTASVGFLPPMSLGRRRSG